MTASGEITRRARHWFARPALLHVPVMQTLFAWVHNVLLRRRLRPLRDSPPMPRIKPGLI